MSALKLYRKRFIPNEIIHLKDDIILKQENDLIITKWLTLNPRTDIHSGISAYFIAKGYKVSKIYDKNQNIVYWYCDIINTIKQPDINSIIFEDLLIDVVIYENGTVEILDLDELPDALELNLITIDKAKDALRTLDSLLKVIYQGQFSILQDHINQAEHLYSSSI